MHLSDKYLLAFMVIAALFVMVSGFYAFSPQLSFASPGFRMLMFIAGAFFLTALVPENNYGMHPVLKKAMYAGAGSLMGLSILGTVYFIAASQMGTFNNSQAKAYASLIGAVQEKSGAELPALDIEKANLVTEEIAYNRALKKLSEQEVAAIGSQYTVGSLHKQIVKGELRWVGYLEPRGFFRWFLENGTPGYVSVSASDETDAVLVTKLDGKPISITRGTAHWFNQDVNRAFSLESPTTLTYAPVPEIDDNGRPYWVSPTYEREVSNDGLVVTGVMLMDAQTGEVTHHKVGQVPAWVDQVFRPWLLKENINNYGEFKNGAWNFANEGKLQVQDIDLVFGANGRSTVVASIAAMGKNSTGLFGFMVADTQTGEVSYYGFTAVEENEASKAILGSLPKSQLDYSVSDPRPYLVNGIPTYVAMAYTGVGANKQYAFAAIDNPQKVAVRGSLQAAYQAYLALPSTPSQISVNGEMETTREVQTKVKRIAPVGKGYQVLFEGDETIYTADAEVLLELGLTQVGDRVKVSVTTGNALQGSILELDNLEFGPKVQATEPKDTKTN